jgi:CxxC motif-containing protein (DUF1111 family)
MARAGEVLFKHEWQPNDPLCGGGDGLGPVYNAASCVACHHQGGAGGAGGLQHNVTSFTVEFSVGVGSRSTREGVVHAHGVGLQETLRDIASVLPAIPPPPLGQLLKARHSDRQIGHVVVSEEQAIAALVASTAGLLGAPEGYAPLLAAPAALFPGRAAEYSLHALVLPLGVHISQRNTPALFGAQLIDQLPDEVIVAVEKAQEQRWGTVPRNAQGFPVGRALHIRDERGRVGRFGWKAQTASLSEFVRAACANELGLANQGHPQPRPLGQPDYPQRGLDLTAAQCDRITAFVASLPRPVERLPDSAAGRQAVAAGKQLFGTIGCADCHTPNLGSVAGIYSDLLLHNMSEELGGGGSYGGTAIDGASPGEWRTPPLWGLADSAPYLHDGRAATLDEAIRLHGGQGLRAAQRFKELADDDRARLVTFLKTLRAP